jgi:hypothetical protein
MLHHTAGAKWLAAGWIAGAVGIQQAAAAAGVEIDAGHLISLALAGAMGLIAALISAAWKDMRHQLKDAKHERDQLRVQLSELQSFRIRATWVCPFLDPHATPEQQRRHLQQHLEQLESD